MWPQPRGFDPSVLYFLSRFSHDDRIVRTIQKRVREEIQNLNAKVRDINKISDPRKQHKAIESYKDQMVKLLKLLQG